MSNGTVSDPPSAAGQPAADPETAASRTLRGAVCGAVAAVVWAIQQPVDKALFQSRYDDVEVLGRAVKNGPGWYPAGLALHAQNGALFGAMYANVAPALPIPPAVRGPALALTELVVTWPLAAVSDRFHPARDQLPAIYRSRRAFAQATWRHILFGFVLGELDRRLSAGGGSLHGPAPDYASNGHGSLDRAMSSAR
ncbi:MAG TPA: hypothetical protein VEF89_16930 [Solirubrobacteraceae bacterium]|nr:hypothetical protein [Solirubrobacteraceae bacterium]